MSRNTKASRRPPQKRGGGFRRVLLVLLGVIAVAGGVLAVVDIAGPTIVSLAQNFARDELGMNLAVGSVRGNPIRGYHLEEITLSAQDGRSIFSAASLSGNINFASLFRGAPRLSRLAIGGVDMDLDTFIGELSKLKLPEQQSETSEIPIDIFSLQDSRFTSRWGEVSVQDISAQLDGPQTRLNVKSAVNGIPVAGPLDLTIKGKTLGLNRMDLSFGKGSLTAAGVLRPVSETDRTTELDFQGSLKGIDLKEVTALWPAFLKADDYDGQADADFTVKGTGSSPVISLNLKYQGRKAGGYPLERLLTRARYAENRLSLEDIDASALGVPLTGSAALAMRPGETPSIMLKLAGQDAPLGELSKFLPALGGVQGEVRSFTAEVHGPTNALSGTIELSAPRVAAQGKSLSDIALQIKLAQSDTASVSGKFFFEDAQGYIQGSIASILSAPQLNLTVKLLKLDVKRIADLIPDSGSYGLAGMLDISVAIQGPAGAPRFSGTLSSPEFKAQGQTVVNPSVSFAYDKAVLTIQKSSGSLNGMPAQLNGTIGPLTAKAVPLNLTAQLTLNPETLKTFVPDIASYQLKGEVRAGVKLTGALPRPDISLVASSPALSALGQLDVKNLEVSTALGGDLSKLDKLDVSLRADALNFGGIGLQAFSGSLRKDGDKLNLPALSARSGSGTISGSGSALLGKSPSLDLAFDLNQLDLAFDLNQLDLAPLAKSGGLSVPLAGLLSGKLEVKGPSDNPNFAFKGQSSSLSVQGFTFSNVTADVSGTSEQLKLNSLKASLGSSPLSASGMIHMKPSLKADLALSGSNLDLAALTSGVPDLKGQLKGQADLTFNVSSTTGGNSGSGELTVPDLEAYGLKLSNVLLPLSLEGSTLKSQGGTAGFYGGSLSNSLTLDLATLKFSNALKAEGVDVDLLTQDAAGGLKGRVTGKGTLSMNLNGSMGDYSGTGEFSMGAGGLSKFKGLDIVTRLYGVDAIRYVKVHAPLELRTGRLILKKGSQATAPEGDPLYQFARITEDASVTFDKKLYIPADGRVNFQLINALAGGALGGASSLLEGGIKQLSSGAGLEGLLKGDLAGGREGGASADFRDVSVKVTGFFDKPSVTLVKVGPSSQQAEQLPEKAAPAQEQPAKPADAVDAVKDKLRDAIIPQQQAPQQQPETSQPEEQKPQKKAEDMIKDAIRDAIAPQEQTPQGAQQEPQQPEASQPEKKAEDMIKDVIRDAIAPQQQAPQPPQEPQPQQPEAAPQEQKPQEQEEPQSLEDQLKKKLGDELKKIF
ncbi:MAG: hypothetical protein GX256_03845 [Fretibacterium sp.]|nr:hypothetical protein [Fretibacterium sp.]